MNTLDAILTRRSCREFTDKPIKSVLLIFLHFVGIYYYKLLLEV